MKLRLQPSTSNGHDADAERLATALGTTSGASPPRKVLAISSGGGHWVQMLRLLPAFAGHQLVFVTVSRAYRCDVRGAKFYAVMDATAWDKVKLCGQALQILLIMLRERPDTVISTGAAPGYFALRFAKLLGCHTVWIDSIANVECLSMSGRQVAEYADLWLTQWPHLALDSGPQFRGAVL